MRVAVIAIACAGVASCAAPSYEAGESHNDTREMRVEKAFDGFREAISSKESLDVAQLYRLGDEVELADGTKVSFWIFDDNAIESTDSRCVWIDVIQPGDSGEGTGSCTRADENLKVDVDAGSGVAVGFAGSWRARSVIIYGPAEKLELGVTGGYFMVTRQDLVNADQWSRVELYDSDGDLVAAADDFAIPGTVVPVDLEEKLTTS